MKGMKEHHDMSEYSKESGLYDGENKKVLEILKMNLLMKLLKVSWVLEVNVIHS